MQRVKGRSRRETTNRSFIHTYLWCRGYKLLLMSAELFAKRKTGLAKRIGTQKHLLSLSRYTESWKYTLQQMPSLY